MIPIGCMQREQILIELRNETPLIMQLTPLERRALETVLHHFIDHTVYQRECDIYLHTASKAGLIKSQVALYPELMEALKNFVLKIGREKGSE